MIKSLSKEQEKLMHQTRQEWLDFCLNCKEKPIRKEIVKSVKWLYKLVGLKEPVVIVLDSPLACQLAVNLLKNKKIFSQVRSQVDSQVYSQVFSQVDSQVDSQVYSQVRSQVRSQVLSQVDSQVGSQVRSQVDSQVGSQVRSQVDSQVGSQVFSQVDSQVGLQKQSFFDFSYDSLGWAAGWLAFYDFFFKIGIVKHKLFEEYKKAMKTQIFFSIYLKKVAVVCTNPIETSFLNGRLHSDIGGAVKWRDGYKNYFLQGVSFPEPELFWKIVKKELPAKKAIELKNIEQRTVALETLGYDRVLKELKGKVLSSEKSRFFPSKEMQVIEVDLKDDDVPAVFFKFVDASTGKSGVLRVNPREISEKTCKACSAWTFGIPEKDYTLEVET